MPSHAASVEGLLNYSIRDEIRAWIVECIVREDGARVTMEDLRDSYCTWAKIQHLEALSESTWRIFTAMPFFGQEFAQAYFERLKEITHVEGYRLRTQEDD